MGPDGESTPAALEPLAGGPATGGVAGDFDCVLEGASTFCGPVFVLWNPPLAAALLSAYGVVVNLPFIMIQRYNRFRIAAVLQHAGK